MNFKHPSEKKWEGSKLISAIFQIPSDGKSMLSPSTVIWLTEVVRSYTPNYKIKIKITKRTTSRKIKLK